MFGDCPSLLRLSLCSSSNAGIQFMNSIQFALAGPLFESEFKLPGSSVALIMALTGPISGIVIHTLVGAWSDSCRSRCGKRLPFITLGSGICAIGMLAIAFSALLGDALGNKEKYGLPIAVSGFVVMNLAANVVQGPARNIVEDFSPPGGKQRAHALVTSSMMISAIIAPLVGSKEQKLTMVVLKFCFRCSVLCRSIVQVAFHYWKYCHGLNSFDDHGCGHIIATRAGDRSSCSIHKNRSDISKPVECHQSYEQESGGAFDGFFLCLVFVCPVFDTGHTVVRAQHILWNSRWFWKVSNQLDSLIRF